MKPTRFTPSHLARAAAVLTFSATMGLSAHAARCPPVPTTLCIEPTFNAGVSAAASGAFLFAAAEFEALYTDAVIVNITVATNASGLGGSNTALQGTLTYATVRADLINDNTAHASANGTTSVSAGGSVFTTTNPTNGVFFYSFAQAKALGARSATNAATDGTFTYNSTLTYTFDPNNRGTGGFDFIGVAEHEISEIMGRITLNGQILTGTTPDYMPYDLFSFTGFTAHSTATGAGRYFSINNGTTNLHGFNNAAVNGGDAQDWDASIANDPYNAFTGSNQGHAINATDIATLDVIGWDLAAPAVPEPASWALFLAGMAAVGSTAYRRRPRA